MPDLMKNRAFAALCLYINYVVHGIGVLIMSLNMHALELQWGTDAAGVAVVISSLGLGRLSVLFLAGTLSDRWGRKPFVLAGMAVYFSFFGAFSSRRTSFSPTCSAFSQGAPTASSTRAPTRG